MSRHPFEEHNRLIAADFARRARQFGDSPEANHWRDLATQEKRIEVLLEIADLSRASILDFGCGTGQLYAVLERRGGFRGTYTGWDISAEMLEIARRRFPAPRFAQVDLFAAEARGRFDYVLVSGVFNNRLDDSKAFFEAALPRLFALCRKGVAFNGLSTYVDYQDPDLHYMDPVAVFGWIKKSITPLATLRHDYRVREGVVPYEFTIYMRRVEEAGRG